MRLPELPVRFIATLAAEIPWELAAAGAVGRSAVAGGLGLAVWALIKWRFRSGGRVD